MASLIVDIDGTTMEFGTNKFLPGAVDTFKKLIAGGHQLIFITRRPVMGGEVLKDIIQKAIGSPVILICGVQGPRIIVDDTSPGAIWHPINEPWKYDLSGLGKS